MYLRPEVIVSDWNAVERFLFTNSLGLLTTSIPLTGQSTIQASHIPFHFVPPATQPPTTQESHSAPLSSNSIHGTWNSDSGKVDLGKLRCHLTRANPQAKSLLSFFSSSPSSTEQEVLIVFSDPVNQAGYISPQWYTETKPATGKVVPTWNYSELQIYGTISPLSSTALSQLVRDLSDTHEQKYVTKVGKEGVWKVEDAPEKYIEILERAIVGMEVTVTKVGFKCKMSQEKGEPDRQGVLAGLREVGGDAQRMAALSQDLGPLNKTS